MPPFSARRRAELALLTVALLWGLTFPLIKTAMGETRPFTFLALRFGTGLVLVMPFVRLSPPPRSSWGAGAALALLLGASYWAQTYGLVFTTATRSAFLSGLSVVLVPLVYPFVTRRPPEAAALAGAALAVAGLYVFTDLRAGGLNRGDALTLLGAFAYSIYLIALERSGRRHRYRDLVSLQIVILAVLFLPFAVFERAPTAWDSPGLWIPVAGTALVLAGTMLLQTRFQKDTAATRAAVILTAEPVFAAGFAYLLLGEAPTAVQGAGAGLILAGILAVARR